MVNGCAMAWDRDHLGSAASVQALHAQVKRAVEALLEDVVLDEAPVQLQRTSYSCEDTHGKLRGTPGAYRVYPESKLLSPAT